MIKEQLEAKISEAVNKFEIEYIGRTAKQIKTVIINDLIIIRLQGFLSWSEQNLAVNDEGIDLIKKIKLVLFENSQEYLAAIIKEITGCDVINMYSDVCIKTGEKVILITLSEYLEI
ncbi:DUF2294 domain-containing protein [Cellulosilyticum sp. I15G10I2]|uniref:DUF2294 domain-containing protein n=1 Tax=Cellulosilyticum sp. I15G10I2 TaxID=1892843 RepID=UPI00085BB6CB|nr:DUF2294 domain-containing protein [Cellulosilyticum sp. I15G10I2]